MAKNVSKNKLSCVYQVSKNWIGQTQREAFEPCKWPVPTTLGGSQKRLMKLNRYSFNKQMVSLGNLQTPCQQKQVYTLFVILINWYDLK